jgi:hypothetical protein
MQTYSPPSYSTTVHVRPAGGVYGEGDGSNYENATAGFAAIAWGGIVAGTRILVHGTHNEALVIGASGTEEAPIIIQAGEAGTSGIIDSQGTRNIGVLTTSKNYIHIDGVISKNAVVSCFETSGTSAGVVYNNTKGQNSGNQAYQSLNTASAIYYNVEGTGCVDDGFSMHDSATAHIYGGSFSYNAENLALVGTATLEAWGIALDNSSSSDIYLGPVANNPRITLYNCTSDGYLQLAGGELNLIGGLFSGRVYLGAGVLSASKTIFDSANSAEIIIDAQTTSTVNVGYCLFRGMAAGKYALTMRAGSTGTAYNNVFYSPNNVGNGMFAAGDIIAKNNICVGLDVAIRDLGGLTATNNCLHDNITDFLAGSQSAGILADPLFVEPLSGDYRLQLTSPCFGAGVAVGLTSDYTGETFDPYQWYDTELDGTPIQPSVNIPTRSGTKKWYQEPFASAFGYSNWPARTNLFLNSNTPVTQNITTTAQQYTISVLGTGDVTVSGTATGTATEGSPLTVTATAGTLTCTVTGTLSRVQVEAGAFASPWIETLATTVTRAATNLSNPLTLAPQMQLVVIPAATGTAGTLLDDGTNKLSYNGTNLIFTDGITTLSAAATLTAGTAYTIGVKGLAGDWALSLNTVDLDTDATGTVVAWATAKLGRNAADGDHFAGYFPNAAGFSGSDPLWYKTNLGA